MASSVFSNMADHASCRKKLKINKNEKKNFRPISEIFAKFSNFKPKTEKTKTLKIRQRVSFRATKKRTTVLDLHSRLVFYKNIFQNFPE